MKKERDLSPSDYSFRERGDDNPCIRDAFLFWRGLRAVREAKVWSQMHWVYKEHIYLCLLSGTTTRLDLISRSRTGTWWWWRRWWGKSREERREREKRCQLPPFCSSPSEERFRLEIHWLTDSSLSACHSFPAPKRESSLFCSYTDSSPEAQKSGETLLSGPIILFLLSFPSSKRLEERESESEKEVSLSSRSQYFCPSAHVISLMIN